MVESEFKYNEFRKKQEKQRNWDYNVLLKVVRLKLLWVVLLVIGCGVISFKVIGSGFIDFYDYQLLFVKLMCVVLYIIYQQLQVMGLLILL